MEPAIEDVTTQGYDAQFGVNCLGTYYSLRLSSVLTMDTHDHDRTFLFHDSAPSRPRAHRCLRVRGIVRTSRPHRQHLLEQPRRYGSFGWSRMEFYPEG